MANNSYEKMWKKIMKDRNVSKEEAIKILEEELSPYPDSSWKDAKLKNKKAIKAKRKVV